MLVLAGVAVCGCHRPSAKCGSTLAPREARVDVGHLEVGAPLVHANLAVFPVHSREPRSDDRYITLDEGLRAGTVEIMETGAALAIGQAPSGQAPATNDATSGDRPAAEPRSNRPTG